MTVILAFDWNAQIPIPPKADIDDILATLLYPQRITASWHFSDVIFREMLWLYTLLYPNSITLSVIG